MALNRKRHNQPGDDAVEPAAAPVLDLMTSTLAFTVSGGAGAANSTPGASIDAVDFATSSNANADETAEEIMSQIHDYYEGSSLYSLRLVNPVGVGSIAFVVSWAASSYIWEALYRRAAGGTIVGRIDPTGAFITSGDLSTASTASGFACPEETVISSVAVNTSHKLLVHEGTVMNLIQSSGAPLSSGYHAGVIGISDHPGVDGHGMLGGQPTISAGGTSWVSDGGGTLNQFRVGESGNVADDWLGNAEHYGEPQTVFAGDDEMPDGTFSTLPIQLTRLRRRKLMRLKYLQAVLTARAYDTVIQNNDDSKRRIHLGVGATSQLVAGYQPDRA